MSDWKEIAKEFLQAPVGLDSLESQFCSDDLKKRIRRMAEDNHRLRAAEAYLLHEVMALQKERHQSIELMKDKEKSDQLHQIADGYIFHLLDQIWEYQLELDQLKTGMTDAKK